MTSIIPSYHYMWKEGILLFINIFTRDIKCIMKGVILLSFVMGYVSTKMAAIASDGRCCYTDGTIKTEFYNKTRKINRNVILGYSGSTESCEKVLDALQPALEQVQMESDREAYVNEVATCIHRAIPLFNFPKGKNVQFIVSGISDEGTMQLYSFGNTNQTNLVPLTATNDKIQTAVLCPPGEGKGEIGKKIFNKHLINGLKSQNAFIEDIFKASISEMADLDQSVNENCFFQIIFPTDQATNSNPQL